MIDRFYLRFGFGFMDGVHEKDYYKNTGEVLYNTVNFGTHEL